MLRHKGTSINLLLTMVVSLSRLVGIRILMCPVYTPVSVLNSPRIPIESGLATMYSGTRK